MFTGIVESLGVLKKITPMRGGLKMKIFSALPRGKLQKGRSIAVNGVCLTVEEFFSKTREFQVSVVKESLKRTNFEKIRVGATFNLETSLDLKKSLDGHLVSGHVDFTTKVLKPAPNLRVVIPTQVKKFFPLKGSVCLHGVSLTICKLGKGWLEVALIPATLKVTNLKNLKVGDSIHVEIDVLARYLDQLIKH